MKKEGLHPGLEMRLAALESRIAELRNMMSGETGAERIQILGDLERLSQRQRGLAEQLAQINSEGSGWRQNLKAEFEKRIDDFSATVDDFMMRLDRKAP